MTDASRPRAALWLALAYLPFVLNDFLFISAHGEAAFVAIDYGTRLLVLALLLAPAVRPLAYAREDWKWPTLVVLVSVFACFAIDQAVFLPIQRAINDLWRGSRLFAFPAIEAEPLKTIDILIGVPLTALSEELLCRAAARRVLERYECGPVAIVLWSSLAFALIHWSNGIGNVAMTALNGAAFMCVYLGTRSLAGPVLAHYLVDMVRFYG